MPFMSTLESTPRIRTIGFIGSGNIGSQLARLAVKQGYDVVLSNSRGPETLEPLIMELGGHARAATPAEAALPYLEEVDIILVMTVEPGFGGQKFMSDMLPKIELLRSECERRGRNIHIQVDGGINAVNAAEVKKAGADVLVAGSAVFNAADCAAAIKELREA